ncbi:hypothetical protein HDV63DRAFT_158406 [Trichoderma sp. SZMC 28014]
MRCDSLWRCSLPPSYFRFVCQREASGPPDERGRIRIKFWTSLAVGMLCAFSYFPVSGLLSAFPILAVVEGECLFSSRAFFSFYNRLNSVKPRSNNSCSGNKKKKARLLLRALQCLWAAAAITIFFTLVTLTFPIV